MSTGKEYQGGSLEGLGGPVNVDAYHFGGIDPTLDSCCQREIQSNRKYNALTSTLKRHDVTALAERRRRNLVTTPAFDGCRCCYDPNSDGHGEYAALIDYKNERQGGGGEVVPNNESDYVEARKVSASELLEEKGEDSDDEFDYLLDEDLPGDDCGGGGGGGLKEAEDARRIELEWEILQRQVAVQHGYGCHRQLHPARVLKAAGLAKNTNLARPPPPAVVLHLVDPESVSSASLDYFLESQLASAYAGTIFLRSGGRSTLLMDPVLAQTHFARLNPDDNEHKHLPALVAIRDGRVVNICPGLKDVCRVNGGEVEFRAVEIWLEHSGVLLDRPPPFDSLCYIRPEEDALMDYLAPQKPQEEEERFDCGLDGCSKSFPHEHVGVKTEQQDGLVVKEETVVG